MPLTPNVTRWKPVTLQVIHALDAADAPGLAIAGTLGLSVDQLSDLILSIIQKESAGYPSAVGDGTCSWGLMQFNWCAHHTELQYLKYPNPAAGPNPVNMLTVQSAAQIADPFIGISLGTRYLLAMMREFQSVNTAILAYNAGPGRTYQWTTGELPRPINQSYLDGVLSFLGVSSTFFEDLKKKPQISLQPSYWLQVWDLFCTFCRGITELKRSK